MPNFCPNCAAPLDADARFCPSCKASVGLEEKAKHTWQNLTTSERVVFLGAVGMFVSYFLPWFTLRSWIGEASVGAGRFGIVMPLAASVVSCIMLYRSLGATTAKRTRARRWQVMIGAWGTISSFLGLFMASNTGSVPAIGAYLCTAGSAAVLVGAFMLKKDQL